MAHAQHSDRETSALVQKHLAAISAHKNGAAGDTGPRVINVHELLERPTMPIEYLVEPILTTPGCWALNGASKAGKTLFSLNLALSIHAGRHFLDNYLVKDPVGVLFVEQDDASGVAGLKSIIRKSSIPLDPQRFFAVEDPDFVIGDRLIEFLEREIMARGIGLVVLDSYTKLRGARGAGVDIVKAESMDFTRLDMLAKRTGCVIIVLHHKSKGSAGMDWSECAAGTFAISAATEGQIFINRFNELPGNAPERLVRIRGRHIPGAELVVRLTQRLDYEFVLEGGAAEMYPTALQIQHTFGDKPFSPKSLSHETGMSRATAHRVIGRLLASNAIRKQGYGEYALVVRL